MIKMINFTILSLLFASYLSAATASDDSGPMGPIDLSDVRICEGMDPSTLWVELKPGPDRKQRISMSITTDKDIDSTALITIRGHKFNNGNWEQDSFTIEDKPLFKTLSDFTTKPWQDFQRDIQPPIVTPGLIPAGFYKIEGLYTDYTGITTPVAYYGRYRGEAIMTLDDEIIACFTGEIVFKPPGAF